MKTLQTDLTFTNFAERCTSCKLCCKDCTLLQSIDFTPAQIARKLLHSDFSDELVNAVQKCSLCGQCSQNCPHDLNPAELMQAARYRLVAEEKIDVSAYRPLLVDQKHHFFNLFRKNWEIDYRDLTKGPCTTLFFPGCSLASFAPELTRLAFQWLLEQGLNVGLNDDCCGLPLKNIGLTDRTETHLEALKKNFNERGVKQIVVACPNCFYHLRSYFHEIQVKSIYQLMVEAGVKISGFEQLTIHDSCPDRFSGEIGRSVRALLPAETIKELPHHGADTQCCGAGGIVSMVAPQVSDQRATSRISEIRKNETNHCISSCMGCVKRLTSADTEAPQSMDEYSHVVHILELFFKQPIDHQVLDQQLSLMWQGERGQKNLKQLNETRPDNCDKPSTA